MKDVRWLQRFSNFRKALKKLLENIQFIKDSYDHLDLAGWDNLSDIAFKIEDIYKQGLIQSFEFTHELSWNLMKDFAEYQGNMDIRGSRDATLFAANVNLIENAHQWMDMIQSRNKTSHTYNEETANEIFISIILEYSLLFVKFEQKLESIKSDYQ